MLRCKDNSIYTGITTDLKRRFSEHLAQNEKCAKYTLTHEALKLESAWQTENRVLASKLEFFLKTLTKEKKERLLKDSNLLESFLGTKIDSKKYMNVELNELM